VDEVIDNTGKAGGSVVKKAVVALWGYFSDPDDSLWKIASAS